MTEARIHALIRARRSSRAYDPERPVTAETIDTLLEAAGWAASGGNLQPWRYLVFDDRHPPALEEARACLDAGNQAWARRAPLLLLAVMQENRPSGKPNATALHDAGMANAHLLLQATAMGLHCRPMAGFDALRTARSFGIPEGFRPVVMIALGYPGDPAALPVDLQGPEAAPRQRRPVTESAFLGGWGPGR